jgi:hypothetical protein
MSSIEFLNILDTVKFGIEFECCFHILDHPLFVRDEDDDDEEGYDKELLKCFRYKNPEVEWQLIDKDDEVD